MKAVILAGGLGQRISEETANRPKPMVEIGGKPIIWHIMKGYAAQGVREFIICLGYKGYIIKDYFTRYFLYNADITIDFKTEEHIIHQNMCEDWRVTLVDTGEHTMTGGRIKRILPYVKDDPFFFLTYGDTVSDVDFYKLVKFHKAHGKSATVTAVQPTGRFGRLCLENDLVTDFEEKPKGDGAWVSGGFFILNPSIANFIDGDDTVFEQAPLPMLAQAGELAAYRHYGFWQCMDTLRDKNLLEDLWARDNPPWKTWR